MITRKFDTGIYPLKFIKEAAKDFSHVATVIVVPFGDVVQCCFFRCKNGDEITANEFSNYLIDLIGSRG